MRQKILKNKKKIIILGVILIIFAMLFNKGTSLPRTIKVDGLIGDKISTTEKHLKLDFHVDNVNISDKVMLLVNNKETVTFNSGQGNYYTYPTLMDGENKLKITVNRSSEQINKEFIITLQVPPPTTVSPSPNTSTNTDVPKSDVSPEKKLLDDSLFEAEITCQEYAESYYKVKDIDISYDSSSIKRKNTDSTLLIKVNIADSGGVFGRQKPLGTMECTTTSDGMRVINFLAY